jgi:hypothetical protein
MMAKYGTGGQIHRHAPRAQPPNSTNFVFVMGDNVAPCRGHGGFPATAGKSHSIVTRRKLVCRQSRPNRPLRTAEYVHVVSKVLEYDDYGSLLRSWAGNVFARGLVVYVVIYRWKSS